MDYIRIEEVNETHRVSEQIMLTKSREIFKLNREQFIEKFSVIPEDVVNTNDYKQSFINQIISASGGNNQINPFDDIDTQFADAIGVMHTNIHRDYHSLRGALKQINIAPVSMKELYQDFLPALDFQLTNDQMWKIYKHADDKTKRRYFAQQNYTHEHVIKLRADKNLKNLIRHLRDDRDLEIILEPSQLKRIYNELELGDLINLDNLTSTTKSKATDFWSHMLVTCYRWSGSVAETITIARFLPFLATVNNYLIAPIVIGLGFIVALFNFHKYHFKEAKRHKKFVERCITKVDLKKRREALEKELEEDDNIEGTKAHKIIEAWIRKAGLADNFEQILDEAEEAPTPMKKLSTLQFGLEHQRDLLNGDDIFKTQLKYFIDTTLPAAEPIILKQNPENINQEKSRIFDWEVPYELKAIWLAFLDFVKPIWVFLKELFAPYIQTIADYIGPYLMPSAYGLFAAAGIITLTLFYTTAPEVLIPITILALIVAVGTAVVCYLRDRQKEMYTRIDEGAREAKTAVKNDLEDLEDYKASLSAIKDGLHRFSAVNDFGGDEHEKQTLSEAQLLEMN